MKFIVIASERWDNGYFCKLFTFDELCEQFENDGHIQDEELGVNELDLMMDNVIKLNINEVYTHQFFFNEQYTFKRTL
jgi:hypothetical protein